LSLNFLFSGEIIDIAPLNHTLNLLGRIYCGMFGVILWEPLEIFFFIWMIDKSEAFFNWEQKHLLKGIGNPDLFLVFS
jgi:hypothetical protein